MSKNIIHKALSYSKHFLNEECIILMFIGKVTCSELYVTYGYVVLCIAQSIKLRFEFDLIV